MKGGLMPGQMLLVDPAQGRILWDEELKESMASERPWREWMDANLIRASDLPLPARPAPAGRALPELDLPPGDTLSSLAARFGICHEDVAQQIAPMARTGSEPIVSMGVDVPLAVLSEHPRRLFGYFKQLFAQVTNPPIDALREKVVTEHGPVPGQPRQRARGRQLQLPPHPAGVAHPRPGGLRTRLRHRQDRLQGGAPVVLLPARRRGGRPGGGAGTPGRAGRGGRGARVQHRGALRPRLGRRRGARPQPALPGVGAPPPASAPACAPRRTWWSKPGTRWARTTSPCSWATPRAASTPTSPTPSSATACAAGWWTPSRTRPSPTSTVPQRRASCRSCPRWASPRCRATTRPRSSRPWASPTRWWRAASPAR